MYNVSCQHVSHTIFHALYNNLKIKLYYMELIYSKSSRQIIITNIMYGMMIKLMGVGGFY